MLGRHLFWLVSLLCLTSECSSVSSLRRSLVRRQADAEPCQAIQGFDCKCTSYRATCTNDRDLPSPLVVLESAKGRYQSVEIVLTAPRDLHVNEQTFEPIHQLFKVDGQNYEFRVKFEKFTALHLASPSLFNRVFPDANPNARKHIALEIYNPDVPPQDNNRLFENLNVDSLELYALYPFHGTFQQLFQGANIKYLRLSGGEIRSDFSQPFTGNVARLELAKQATSLSVENFPVYPAHELIINAFYISDFSNEHVPNYNNLAELRVHSTERIPANAFQRFSNLHTLSVTSEKEIDPQAFNGLNQLEKLVIKDTKPSQELLAHLPPVKEFETNVDKLDERTQCQLLEKLATGQLALQAVPNGRECTCVAAYLDKAAGRSPCDAQGCESSSCATIRNNYDANTREFQSPPPIRRADGSDALRQREPKVYSNAYQVSTQDQDKLNRAIPPQQQQQHQDHDHQQQPDNRPSAPSYGDDRYDDYYRHYPTEHREDHPAPPMRDDHHHQQPQSDPQPHPEPHSPPSSHPHQHEDEDEDEDDNDDAHHGDHVPSSPDQNANGRFGNDYDEQVAETRTTTQADREPWHHPPPHHQHDDEEQQPSGPSRPPQQQQQQQEVPFQSDYDLPADDGKKGDESHPQDHQHQPHQPDEARPSPNDGPVGGGSASGKTDDDGDENNDGTKDDNNNNNNDGTNADEQSNREPGDGTVVNPVGPNGEAKGGEGEGDGDGQETTSSTDAGAATKGSKMSWWPIIIIVGAIVGILLLGAIYMFVIRPKRAARAGGAAGSGGAATGNTKGYQQAPSNEQAAARA